MCYPELVIRENSEQMKARSRNVGSRLPHPLVFVSRALEDQLLLDRFGHLAGSLLALLLLDFLLVFALLVFVHEPFAAWPGGGLVVFLRIGAGSGFGFILVGVGVGIIGDGSSGVLVVGFIRDLEVVQ